VTKTYAGLGGRDEVQFRTEACERCGKSHILYNRGHATVGFLCSAAGAPTYVQTQYQGCGVVPPQAVVVNGC
jgi:hypothetical protein